MATDGEKGSGTHFGAARSMIVAFVEEVQSCFRAGTATGSDILSAAILMFSPPFSDAGAAREMLSPLLDSDLQVPAAVWDVWGYIDDTLAGCRPTRALAVLAERPGSALAQFTRATFAALDDPDEAVRLNRLSLDLRRFPNNLLMAIQRDPELTLGQRRTLYAQIDDLMLSRTAESDRRCTTLDGWVQRYWDECIYGTRATAMYWQSIARQFGP